MTKLIYLLNSQQDFVAVFIENLKNNTIPVLLIAPTLIAIVLIIYGVKSDWFAKLFGSGRSVSQSRIALADYLSRIETLMYEGENPLPLTEPLDKKDGAVSPASVIERSIQTLRNFNDPQGIKNWRELYQADIIVTESILDRVLQFEILLRLLQYGNDGTTIINCMKSVNEFWLLVTQGKVREEDGQIVTLFPEEKVGYGVTAVKKAERPMFYIKPALSEHPVFEKFLKKLQHGMTHTEMTPHQIENILKESNMADAPVVFQGARKILADRWMELFNENIHKIDTATEHKAILELLSQIVAMKKTVDVYPELIDISKELEKNQEDIAARWVQQYAASWEKKLLYIETDASDVDVLPSVTEYIGRIHADRAYYAQVTENYGLDPSIKGKFMEEDSVFDQIYAKFLKTAFVVSEQSGSYPFITSILEWMKINDVNDVFGYQRHVQSRLDSFMQMGTVPSSSKMKAVKDA